MISLVHHGHVVRCGEQGLRGPECHVLLKDVPGRDHAHVLDLLERGDVDRPPLGQLLSDQQSFAPECGALFGVLGAL